MTEPRSASRPRTASRVWIPAGLAALALALGALAFLLLRRPDRRAEVATATDLPPIATERAPRTARRTRPAAGPLPVFDEAEGLRRRVGELEAALREVEQAAASPEKTAGAGSSKVPRCTFTVSSECPAFPASREVLLARARCGTLLTDTPRFLGEDDDERPPPANSAEAAAHGLARDFKAEVFRELDGIYRELAGPSYEPAPTLKLLRSRTEALAKEVSADAQRMLAEELAGLRPLPTPDQTRNRPAAERYWRLWTGLGDRYEKRAAAVFGAEVAHDRRVAAGGWAHRNMYLGKCPPESAAGP